jgi:hypothetical protein
MGILAKSFGKQVECAGGDGCGGGPVPKMQVADDDKHDCLQSKSNGWIEL